MNTFNPARLPSIWTAGALLRTFVLGGFLMVMPLLALGELPAVVTSTNQGNGRFTYTFAAIPDQPYRWCFSPYSERGGAIWITAPGTQRVVCPEGWSYELNDPDVTCFVTNGTACTDTPIEFTIQSSLTTSGTYTNGLILGSLDGPNTMGSPGYQHFSYLGPGTGSVPAVVAPPAPEVVFDNSRQELGGQVQAADGIELGDQIVLGGTARVITEFAVGYFLSPGNAGTATLQLAWYANDGPLVTQTNALGEKLQVAAPGTVLYESPVVYSSDGYEIAQLSGMAIEVPDTLTWTIRFRGLEPGQTAALLLYDPPSTGSDPPEYWRKAGGAWQLVGPSDPASPGNFAARFKAIPKATVVTNQPPPSLPVLIPQPPPEPDLGPVAPPVIAARPLEPQAGLPLFSTLSANLLGAYSPDLVSGLIPLYPTNRYTPEVHRLLQVAANLYETTMKAGEPAPDLPTVFRPVLTNDGGSILISGYVQDSKAEFLDNPWVDLGIAQERDWVKDELIRSNINIYGQPAIIGVRKGFPTFNKLVLQSAATISRRLILQKSAGSTILVTNQAHVITLTNYWALEAWNSYTQAWARPVEIRASVQSTITLVHDTGAGFTHLLTTNAYFTNSVSVDTWPGNQTSGTAAAFLLPIATNQITLPPSLYLHDAPYTRAWENSFRPLKMTLLMTNRVLYALLDKQTGRLLDFVNLEALPVDMSLIPAAAFPPDAGGAFGHPGTQALSEGDIWNDQLANSTYPNSPTLGIVNQIKVSSGAPYVGEGTWGSGNVDKDIAITTFLQFLRGQLTNLTWQAPFTPSCCLYKRTSWEANDPLVHFTATDLRDPSTLTTTPSSLAVPRTFPISRDASLGLISSRYRPWGGNPNKDSAYDPLAFSAVVKDPRIWSPDNWEFPTGRSLDLAVVGKVHRGTPWQTIYLKSLRDETGSLVSQAMWRSWAGSFETYPTNDWRVLGVLAPLLVGDQYMTLPSVNRSDLSKLLPGLLVLTNTVPDSMPSRMTPPQFQETAIALGSDEQLALEQAIARGRIALGGRFVGLESLLAIPELSFDSPFLVHTTFAQVRYGRTDEAYEIIPMQLLSLVRSDPTIGLLITTQTVDLNIHGVTGKTYRVEGSPDLTQWLPLGEYRLDDPTGRTVQFPRPPAMSFYRTTELSP